MSSRSSILHPNFYTTGDPPDHLIIGGAISNEICLYVGNGSRDRLHPSHRRERAVQAPPIPQRPVIGPGWICPHERSNNTLPPPEIDVGFTDAATLMLLPPPYSPPEDRPANPYDPPTEGTEFTPRNLCKVK